MKRFATQSIIKARIKTEHLLCCMSREKVSISLDKDEKSLRTFNLQHMVKAMPLTSWHLTNFFLVKMIIAIDANHKSTRNSLKRKPG